MRLVKHRGKWAVPVDGKRLSTGVDAEPENRDLAEREAREILATRTRALTGKTVRQIFDAYIKDMPNRAEPKQPSDGLKYARQAIERFFGDHAPEEVTRDECRAYIARRREEGRKSGTIRKELSALAAALRWHDPATPARFDLPAPGRPRERWLAREELGKLLETAADHPHVALFIHLAIATGARKEAILTLTWAAHVDFERRRVSLGIKQGGKGRAKPIPMTGALEKALRKAQRTAESAFVIEWAGGPIKDIKRALKSAYERAGITGVDAPAHVLRHTAGSYMAMGDPSRGVPPVPMLEISRRLGHSSIKVTEQHYAHLHPDYMQASTAALEV